MTRLLSVVPDDDRPTRGDLTAGDVDLFRRDQAKPAHDRATCTVADCWSCAWETQPAPTRPTGGAA